MSGVSMRQRLLTSTIVGGVAAIAAPAFAQTTQEAPIAPAASNAAPTTVAPSSSDGAPAAESGGDIVVTGSRIPHPDLESASPVTIVGAAEVKQSGTTRIEDLLNALPQVFAGQGGNIANGATGTATIDLRNLGPSRTLVLINGRRLVPGDPRSPVADINIVPAALIKRVDVLTGGASSVYGADAVSGVVNFVMDTEFDGFKIDGQYSLYNHDNRAGSKITDPLNARGFSYPGGMNTDGGTVDATAVFGAGFDDGRGHVTAYAGYRKIKAVTQDKRDYSACSLSANTPANVTLTGRTYTCGGSATAFPANFYTKGSYYSNQGVAGAPNIYNFAPTNYYQRPDERYTAGFFAHYDVSDAFKPYMEFMFMDDRTVAQIAPSGDFFNTSSINCDNPLLSAGLLGVACGAGNTFVDSNGITRGNLYIARRNVEGGGRQDDLQHTTYRGVIGAKGDIAKGVSYEGYYQYSRVDFSQTYRNDFSVSRLNKAIDVVFDPVTGKNQCRSFVDGTDPACVPYDVFNAGGVKPEALNYLQIPLFSRGQTTEQIANASLTFLGSEYGITSPFASEGFALNVGGEYRKETINFEVDSNFLSGDGAGQGGPTTPVAGKLSVKEYFAEASLPLVQDKPFFEDLRVGAGYRKSWYTTDGIDPATQQASSNKFNTVTWKVEGSWAPIHDIKFRGSFNHAVRAPNTVELYGSRSFGLDGSFDPCAGALDSSGTTVNGNTAAQCAFTGVTAAQFGKINANPANQYNGYLGGSADLKPEVSNSLTFGAVLTPSFLPKFQLTVDYFDIKLKKQIGGFGSDAIVSTCISTGDPFFCGLIHRSANGSLFRPSAPTFASGGYVYDINTNAGKLSTRGIDVTASYTQELGNIGALGFSVVGTWLNRLVIDQVGPRSFNCSGLFGAQCGTPSPEWRHKARLTYTLPAGPSLSAAWRYFSAVKDDTQSKDVDLANPLFPGAREGNRKIASQSYFDLAATIPLEDKFTLHAGVNNVLDKSPPINGLGLGVVESGNTFPQVYDALGRYMYVGVTLDL